MQEVEGLIEGTEWKGKIQTIAISRKGKDTIHVHSDKYLKLMVGDAFYGRIDKSRTLINPEVIQVEPFANRSGILNCLNRIFGRKKSTLVQKVFDGLERQSKLHRSSVVNFITKFSIDYQYDSITATNTFSSILDIDTQEGEMILKWWRVNYCKRRLLLLGCTEEEIRNSADYWYNMDTLYDALTTNPLPVLPVSWDTCLKIAAGRELTVIENGHDTGKPLLSSDHVRLSLLLRQYNLTAERRSDVGTIIKSEVEDLEEICHLYNAEIKKYGDEYIFFTPHMSRAHNLIRQYIFYSQRKVEDLNPPIKCANISSNVQQVKAVQMALKENFCCITGSAGTGKTTTITQIAKELDHRGMNYMIAAFTGKATSRINEVLATVNTVQATTIHLLLTMISREKIDYLIIDESSMVSTVLLARVIESLIVNQQEDTRIVFVGDDKQLLPIDEGAPFIELLSALPKVVLETDCRRIDKGNLFWNLKHIENSEYEKINWTHEEKDDMHYIDGGEPDIIHLTKYLKDEGFTDTEVTVVCPYREPIDSLNNSCRNIWNSNNLSTKDFKGREWRVGDRIVMLENRYDIGIMNGEEGRIIGIGGGKLHCSFDLKDNKNKQVFIPLSYERGSGEEFEDLSKLSTYHISLSWCMTVHKSQGSQWKCVIFYIPQNKKASGFLNKKLSYTAISRASEILFCVADYSVLISSISTEIKPRVDKIGVEEDEN